MPSNDSFTKKNTASPNDFAALNKEIKAELMTIVEAYGFKEAPELQEAIDSGKIKIADVKSKVEVILKKKFSEIFNLHSHDELMQAIKNKELNFSEYHSFMSNFLSTVNPAKAKTSTANNKHNTKPLSEG